MKHNYLVKFYYSEGDAVTLPVKADNAEAISEKIISAHLNKNIWLSFPTRDKYTRVLGSERITVNLEKIKYFKDEKPTRLYIEKYGEDDFIEWS
jgi:hypothetical protein